MLFNSLEFIFLFLPVTGFVYFQIGKRMGLQTALAWLSAASLFYYGWFEPLFIVIVLVSVAFNFAFGKLVSGGSRAILTVGIVANLAAVIYFKHANFIAENVNFIADSPLLPPNIILPLAFTFFTLQQIAYLVDTSRGSTGADFLHYLFFVTFFPQLLIGPIVRYREFAPQLSDQSILQFTGEKLSLGLSVFFIGLFKKVVIADGMGVYSAPIFDASALGVTLSFYEAWGGAISYSLQIYFDFSGYADMAIGLALMFGLTIPENFASPYKAGNLIDFWRRWHMTLTKFLTDYLYVLFGGNRVGFIRRYFNIFVTVFLGALLHGAGWTFVLWGAFHAALLSINHAWRAAFPKETNHQARGFPKFVTHTLTLLAITIGWVIFGSRNLDAAFSQLASMAGQNGIALPASLAGHLGLIESWFNQLGFVFSGVYLPNGIKQWGFGFIFMPLVLFIVLYFPNTREIVERARPLFGTIAGGGLFPIASSGLFWSLAVLITCVASLLVIWIIDSVEFIFFQF